jgi:hypothetical protein
MATTQCPFDSADEKALARCLIRPVLRGGHVGPTPGTLPAVLDGLIGHPMGIELDKLRGYLSDRGIEESSVGGAIHRDATRVRFFVIHDTSSPEVTAASFPSNMNEAGWSGNNLSNWLRSDTPTHVFINHVGASGTKANYNEVVHATRYEAGRDIADATRRRQARAQRSGLFVHHELVQPRRRSRSTSSYFDIAPEPGFTAPQLERVALLYVIASYRSGRWLLPTFHCSLDATIAGAHDDPQNFDLDVWLGSLKTLLSNLGSP